MIIKVEISEETMARMLTGKRVEGTMGYDVMTGRKTFNMFHRRSRSRLKDRLIRKTPWGWVKESKERVKVYESMPKSLGVMNIIAMLDDDHAAATDAIIDMDIINRV